LILFCLSSFMGTLVTCTDYDSVLSSFKLIPLFFFIFLQNEDRSLWKLGTLPPGLITFWNKTFPLSRSWHVLGLGYNPHVNSRDIERAAVIHYNGNMKPWLEIGLPKFRSYWSKYLDYDQSFLQECNINPWRNLVLLIPSDITNSLFSVDVPFSVVSIVFNLILALDFSC